MRGNDVGRGVWGSVVDRDHLFNKDGGEMNGTTIERTNIRDAPDGAVIGSLKAGDKITFAQQGTWLLLSSVNGVPRTGYVNARSVRIVQTVPPPPPPPPPSPTKAVTNIITVFEDGSILVTPQ